jgi:hypothetical protein
MTFSYSKLKNIKEFPVMLLFLVLSKDIFTLIFYIEKGF